MKDIMGGLDKKEKPVENPEENIGFTSLDEAISWLNSQPGGGAPTNPVQLVMQIPLGNMTAPGSGWQTLLEAINNSGKYVDLDLSNCSMSSTVFDSNNAIDIGQSKITSLVLPNQAQSLTVFNASQFSNLNHVSGASVNFLRMLTFF